MSLISLQGGATGTGTVTLLAPITSTNRTLTLPDATGIVVSTGSTAVVTPTMLTQPFTSSTAVASTSGTSIDFTGIPSWVKRITVMFVSVSTNGSSAVLLQLGSGSPTTTGYAGSCFGALASSGFGVTNYTTGFGLGSDGGAGYSRVGSVVLTLQSGNTWACAGILGQNDAARINSVGGVIALAATLDRVRITTVNGTDTFDAGSVNILYEG